MPHPLPPVLILAWRRPHTLRQVINALRPIGLTQLYVACDGPNPDRLGEADKVEATRSLIDQEIDWPCEIHHLYSDVNQGCRLGVSRAITWFFEHVEEGIILEDDCVPHPDFFPYCQNLLDRYRYDNVFGVLVEVIFKMVIGAEMDLITLAVTITVGVGLVGGVAAALRC